MIRRRSRSALVFSLAVVLAGGVLGGGSAHAGSPPPPSVPGPSGTPWDGPDKKVTLLTGDTVTLGGPHGATVLPAPGREKIRFQIQKDEHGDLIVIPGDVLVPLSAGRLDRRLFNVTYLAKEGFDDAARANTPLIMQYAGAWARSAPAGATVVRELPSVGAVAVEAGKTPDFWAGVHPTSALAGGIEKIWLDGRVRASLNRSVPQIGAPAAWQAGHTGANTTVAVLDTGIDATHPDLADAVTGAQDFSGSESGAEDRVGHGTHVASIITGNGERYRGVAPETKLLNGKVLNDDGFGQDSWIISGMEWAAASGADVVNLSLGNPQPSDGTDPVSVALNNLTTQTGTLFVVAAGNSGRPETIGSPAAADAALTVGAVDSQEALAEFSSRGPRFGDGAIKPDITAPGVDIVAAKAQDTLLGEPVGDRHVRLSGTSMATPHVAGAAAILAGQHPDWAAGELKPTLMGSAKPNPNLPVDQQGSGRVDVARAVGTSASASPASLNQGTAAWPHEDDEPIVSTLTYRNTGTAPLTLTLATDVRDPAGNPAPAGMFTVRPSETTVPAGGHAEVTVTTDTKVAGPNGRYGGAVVAAGEHTSVRTPITVTKEVATYNVTLTLLDHNGNLTPNYRARFVDVERRAAYVEHDPSGKVTIRVPEGRHYFDAAIFTPTGFDDAVTDFAEPEFAITGNTEIVLDAREGKPVGFTLDQPNAKPGNAFYVNSRSTAWGSTGSYYVMRDFDGFFARPSTTSAPGKFQVGAVADLAEPDGNGGFLGSPYLYHLTWSEDGRVPTELTRRIANRDLATVKTKLAAQAPATFGSMSAGGVFPMVLGQLPLSITEFYTPGVPWSSGVCQQRTPDQRQADSCSGAHPPITYKEGSRTTRRWNGAVIGPAFPHDPDRAWLFAGRQREVMGFLPPLFAHEVPGGQGWSVVDSGRMVLYRNGEQIGESPSPADGVFSVPAADGAYRLHIEASRSVAELSTQQSIDWTFRSAGEPGPPKALPLPVIRFAPRLDDHNKTPAGRQFVLPIYVQRNGSATAGKVGTPKVQVSYDDGATWQAVRLVRGDNRWLAHMSHPAGATFVSLKASVSDADGNAVDQTIIHAYGLS